jgi:hypothetical protein
VRLNGGEADGGLPSPASTIKLLGVPERARVDANIDVDFDDVNRQRVIDYWLRGGWCTTVKWVAQII